MVFQKNTVFSIVDQDKKWYYKVISAISEDNVIILPLHHASDESFSATAMTLNAYKPCPSSMEEFYTHQAQSFIQEAAGL